jgi:hypothetical protein
MKKLTLLVAAALIGVSGTAFAQETDTETTTASTRIIQAISIQPGTQLQFGRIVKPASGNSVVTVTTGGSRSVTSGTAALAGGTVSAATYTVTGEGNQNFSITVPASVTLNRTGGGSLSATLTSSAASGTLSGSLGSPGTFDFSIGGALTIADSTASGDYSGNFNVTVAYN